MHLLLRTIKSIVIAVGCSSSIVLTAYAEPIAKLYSGEGIVEVQTSGIGEWRAVSAGAALSGGDVVQTKDDSRAAILFNDGILVRLNENALIEVETPGQTQEVSVKRGLGFFFSRKPKRFPRVTTPLVSAAVRGTEFVVRVADGSSSIEVLDGAVEASNTHGVVRLKSGEAADVVTGAAPTKRVIVDAADSVQWALYYPAIISAEALERVSAAGPSAQRSVALYRAGKSHAALQEIAASVLASDPLLALYAAGLYLEFGQLNSARELHSSLEQRLGSVEQWDSSSAALYFAQRAVIALTRGERRLAEEHIQRALEADRKSLPTLLAASYVAQAKLDLEGALTFVREGISLASRDPRLLARAASLELSLGNHEYADQLAQAALVESPHNFEAMSLAGFTALIRYRAEEAEQHFRSALTHSGGSGLPFLGLGLSLIRQGRLTQGRLELQKAVGMEPGLALYRSYLGKALFEEESEELALAEYDRAIALDPEDPTSYLYRAYSHLSNNDVVDALRDVEDSIARNNNRAVYRSSLLLDKDSAVRSAGLAEIFSSLGFSRVAQVEAVKSINRDYLNYSAHRLLSDSYRTVFLNDANLSERKVAELLSPLSFNLFSTPGGEASINDYNALFDRPDSRVGINGVASSLEDTLAGDTFVAGRTEKIGYFVGAEQGYANGSKNNNYLRDTRTRAALQYQASADDRLIATASSQHRHVQDSGASADDVLFENYNVGLGYNHSFGSHATLLGQVDYTESRNHFEELLTRDLFIDFISAGTTLETTDQAFLDELTRSRLRELRSNLQYIHNIDLLTVVAGAQWYFADSERVEDSLLIDNSDGLLADLGRRLRSGSDNALNSQDAYLYTTWHVNPWIDVGAGVDFTHLELEDREIAPFFDDTVSRSRWNPKVGITAYPTAALTLRAAYFESLRKSNLEDVATLEPTLIGGINQRFTDLSGVASQNWGLGVDYKWAKQTYLGVEATMRKLQERQNDAASLLEFDFGTLSSSLIREIVLRETTHNTQDILRAYLYQVLGSDFVGTFDYEYYLSENTHPDVGLEFDLHKAALGLRYFDDHGWFAFAVATWREQDRDGGAFLADGVRDFWVVDAGLGYRLPKRHGSVTLELDNIFDRDFSYDQSFGFEEFIAPEFSARLLFAVNF